MQSAIEILAENEPPVVRRLLSIREAAPKIAALEEILGLPPGAKIKNVMRANARLETLEDLFTAAGGTHNELAKSKNLPIAPAAKLVATADTLAALEKQTIPAAVKPKLKGLALAAQGTKISNK